jgi:FAD/FMN-containing dehydrogenase
VTANSNSSLWRSGQPGAVQWQNWEARPAKEESCYIGSSAKIPCGQGRVSLFSAAVQKGEHIEATVRFAKKHDVRLAIKNTGHCYLGRSSAPESLQIATHALQSIEFVDDFFPTRCGKKSESSGSAVTIGAGVQLKRLYTAVAERNLTVVAGLSHTVGAAGGYVQGGGHSPLGTWKGLAADNVLQFEVVTAEVREPMSAPLPLQISNW